MSCQVLITTQKIDKNDPVLGFFHRWVEEFAKQCQKVTVVCLEKGEYDFPANVEVLSLGKEAGKTKFQYLLQFYKYIVQKRNSYDSVFVHMNPEYVVLAGPLWRLWGKKIGLWYVHRNVDFKLRLAEKFVDFIFTVTKESFHLNSKKIIALGHGIDTAYFSPFQDQKTTSHYTVLSVGRITRIKKLEDSIEAVALLQPHLKEKLQVLFVGTPVTPDDVMYKKELETLITQKNLHSVFQFRGKVSFTHIRDFYRTSDLCINAAPTGGIDKAVLEALSCGVPTLFRNKAFLSLVGDVGNELQFDTPQDLAEKISLFAEHKLRLLPHDLHKIIAQDHDVKQLIAKIVKLYESK